jgi:predicted DNA-binding protein with PD1-like motif
MGDARQVRSGRIFMGRVRRGGDLLGEITDICIKEMISLGRVEAIGAVTRACIGVYHQQAREYRRNIVNEPLEIVSFSGNVSTKDGQPFVHAHVLFSDIKGTAYGGHLVPGTVVFACEFVIEAFEGTDLYRKYDKETGLHLWDMKEGG